MAKKPLQDIFTGKNINPLAVANDQYIAALLKEAGVKTVTKKDIAKYRGRNTKDVSNLILRENSPFRNYKAPLAKNTPPPQISPIQPPTINPTNPTLVPEQPDWASQIASLLQPTKPVPPTFEQSGLFNEEDVKKQAEEEYSPYFSNALADLVKGVGRQRQDLTMAQGQAQNTQMSNYLNRGLSRSGGLLGAQQQLGQQQALAQQDLLDEEERKKKELAQRKAGSLQDYRQNAYSRAYNQYLGRNY